MKRYWVVILTIATLLLAACQAPPSPEVKGGPVLTWRREGGVAGFCDVVVVTAESADAYRCHSDPWEPAGSTELTAEQAVGVAEWTLTYASFEFNQADDAIADAMTISIEFNGNGTAPHTTDLVEEMISLAEQLLRQATQTQ